MKKKNKKVKRMSDSQIKRMTSLYWDKGLSLRAVAEKLGCSKNTVGRWVK